MDIKHSVKEILSRFEGVPLHLEGDIWLVPCILSSSNSCYLPLLKPLDFSINNREHTRKHFWSSSEDEALARIVKGRGTKAWGNVARELNSLMHFGLDIRKGRQCRERWINYVDPGLNKGQWTKEEDELLIEMQKELGNKWSEISKALKGRNENSVKNRWKSLSKLSIHQDSLRDCLLPFYDDLYSFIPLSRL